MSQPNSRQKILQLLKTRGPQSVRLIAKQLGITGMGARQHLSELAAAGMLETAREEKQIRGRPLHLWKLTAHGHQSFPDRHSDLAIDLIELLSEKYGADSLDTLIYARNTRYLERYREASPDSGLNLAERLKNLAEIRNREGFMAEIRLLPQGGWLFIENHCPIFSAANRCQQICSAELALFRQLLGDAAQIERSDFAPAGDRRCAYRVISLLV